MIYIIFTLIKPFSEHLCNVDVVIIILEDQETTSIRGKRFIVKNNGDQSKEPCTDLLCLICSEPKPWQQNKQIPPKHSLIKAR